MISLEIYGKFSKFTKNRKFNELFRLFQLDYFCVNSQNSHEIPFFLSALGECVEITGPSPLPESDCARAQHMLSRSLCYVPFFKLLFPAMFVVFRCLPQHRLSISITIFPLRCGFPIPNESITFVVFHFTTIHLCHTICIRFAFCARLFSLCVCVTSPIDDFCVFTRTCLISTLFFPRCLFVLIFIFFLKWWEQ